VQACRRVAETPRRLRCPAEQVLRQQSEPGLRKLLGIGETLARSIGTILI
jgi:hypothetical protein